MANGTKHKDFAQMIITAALTKLSALLARVLVRCAGRLVAAECGIQPGPAVQEHQDSGTPWHRIGLGYGRWARLAQKQTWRMRLPSLAT